MSRIQSGCYVSFVLLFIFSFALAATDAQQQANFDVAAVIECFEIDKKPTKPFPKEARLIHIPLFVSVDVDEKYRKNMVQLRIDFQFLQSQNEIFDYAPRTETFSDIQGTINVENHREKNANLGFDLSGSQPPLKGSAKMGAGRKNRTVHRYEQIPQRQLVAATGTVNRRTGVYFKYLPSSQTSWVGEKELSIIAQVPHDWRAGLIRVKVAATGKRGVIPGVTENYAIAKKVFDVPIVQSGDQAAIQLARKFVSHEQRLKQIAKSSATGSPVEKSIRDFRSFVERSHEPVSASDINRWLVNPRLTSSDQKKLGNLARSKRELVLGFVEVRRELLALNSAPQAAEKTVEVEEGWVKKQ